MNDLPAVGYVGRADRVRQRFDEPALLVTNLTNVRWLTGFTGSNGWVAILPDRLVLGTDGRYGDRAVAELAAAGVDAEILTGFTRVHQHDQLVGTLRVADSGLTADDRVIVDGLLRAVPGAKVTPKEAPSPTASDAAAKPAG